MPPCSTPPRPPPAGGWARSSSTCAGRRRGGAGRRGERRGCPGIRRAERHVVVAVDDAARHRVQSDPGASGDHADRYRRACARARPRLLLRRRAGPAAQRLEARRAGRSTPAAGAPRAGDAQPPADLARRVLRAAVGGGHREARANPLRLDVRAAWATTQREPGRRSALRGAARAAPRARRTGPTGARPADLDPARGGARAAARVRDRGRRRGDGHAPARAGVRAARPSREVRVGAPAAPVLPPHTGPPVVHVPGPHRLELVAGADLEIAPHLALRAG